MATKRELLLNSIANYLTHLQLLVRNRSSQNLQDLNVHSENFFRDLLNLAFGYDLKNINILEKNAQSIDLGDDEARFAIQVTSTSKLSKVKQTYAGFVAKNLDQNYDRLVVLIIGERPNFNTKTIGGNGTLRLSLRDDVWDMPELLRQLGNLSLDKLKKCQDFLRHELTITEPHVANEVSTLVKLVEVLSASDELLSVGKNREDPDPDKKIHDRFADHAVFLKLLYVELHELYGLALAEVKKESDLGHMRIRKLQVYLMNWSDSVLGECNGNPKVALDRLVAKVLGMMGRSDVPFDEGAIRYYLLDQLIACNIFPNKQQVDA